MKQVKLLSGGNPQIAKGDGPGPVRAWLDAAPDWRGDHARKVDALVADLVPGVLRAVRWNSPFYGVSGQGWFLSLHCFTRFLRLTFLNGAQLSPPPPGPSKDPDTRYLDIPEAGIADLALLKDWITQSAARPGWDGF
jgi:hypothetical protein